MPASAQADFDVSGNAVDAGEGVARDLLIDPNTRELVIENGDLVLVRGLPAIRQAVDLRLGLFQGEYWLDETEGMPWFQSILVKRPRPETLAGFFRARILGTVGIKDVTSLDLSYNKQTRELSVSFTASTDYGELNGTTVLRPGKAS